MSWWILYHEGVAFVYSKKVCYVSDQLPGLDSSLNMQRKQMASGIPIEREPSILTSRFVKIADNFENIILALW